MDISTIKPPVEKPEGEQKAKISQGADLAFLQLLAALGLTQAVPVDAGPCSTANGGAFAQIDSPCVDQSTLAAAGTVNALQERMTTGGKGTSAETMPEDAKAQELLAHAVIVDGQNETDSSGAALVQAVTTSVEKATAKDQAVTEQGKPAAPLVAQPDTKGATESLPQATLQKGEPQAVSARLMDVVVSGHAPKEQRPAPAVTPASTSLTPNMGMPASMNPETPVKPSTTTTTSVMWGAVMEPSNLPQSGTDHNSASAEHDGWKERFTSAETNGAQSTSPPVASSFSAQVPSIPSRATVPAVIEAPMVTLPTESPLPASVRFEVQPGDMGRIRVHLSVVDHTVYTNVMTERVEAHDFLVKGSDRFEAGLAAHGLDVGRFQVDVQGQGRQHADRGGTAWSQDDLHRRNPQSSERPMAERHAGDREPDWMHRMINVFA